MIKKYNQFIKESKLEISEEDMNLFSTEPQLQKLISDQKVRLYNKEITFDGNDKQTKEILDQYINKKVTESFDDEYDIYEGLFSKSKKDPVVKEIEEKISNAAFSLKTYGSSKQGSFVNGAKWAIHNLTNEEIDIIKNNTDRDDFSFFGM